MHRLNILIISQSFLPNQSPRGYRTLELAKGLSRLGNKVEVLSLLGQYDYSEFENKYDIKMRSMGTSIMGNVDTTGCSNRNFIIRVINRLFGRYLEFPKIELSFLIRRKLRQLFKENRYDIIISIAIPFSTHWGVGMLKKSNNDFPFWISDCGDPYMGNGVHRPPFYFKYVEKWWCSKTDYITVPVENAKKAYYPQFRNKIAVIPQGFSFSNIHLSNYTKNDIPTFVYSGNTYRGIRDPRKFLEYLSTINIDFRFIVYTKSYLDFDVFSEKLKGKLIINKYIPRDELLGVLSSADFLINLANPSDVQSPSKLIDYYLSKRPILEISTAFDEKEDFNRFLKGDYTNKMTDIDIEKYNITNVANKFIQLYENKSSLYNNSRDKKVRLK